MVMTTSGNLQYRGFIGLVGLTLVVLALALGAGGIWLVLLGGSVFYVAAAIGLLLTGVLLLMRSRWALWTFAGLIVATLAWSLFEVGLDWWPLAARLDVFFVVGAVLLLPWITRSLKSHSARERAASVVSPADRVTVRSGAGLALAGALGAVALVLVSSWFTDPHEIAGLLPPSQGDMTTEGEAVRGVAPGE